MLKALWCIIWGHKMLAKAHTGTMEVSERLTGSLIKIPVYQWEKQKYCLRCEKEIK